MVTAIELIQRLKAEPFRPFHLRLADGQSVLIPNLGTLAVAMDHAYVPHGLIQAETGRYICETTRRVPLDQIVGIDDADASATAGAA